MFPVRPETVSALYEQQHPEYRGVVRLDVSSRINLHSLQKPFDLPKAQTAVADRFVRSVAGFVDGVTVNWLDGHPKDWIEFLRVKSETEVRYQCALGKQLCRVFGLDPCLLHPALDMLGCDFFHALQDQPNLIDFKIEDRNGSHHVSAMGYPYPSVPSLLGGTDSEPRTIETFVENGKFKR